jgi:hypothetical protein
VAGATLNPAVLGSVPFPSPAPGVQVVPVAAEDRKNALSVLLVLLITYRRHCLETFGTLEIRLIQ